MSYLKRVAGLRTVPVELGSRYTDHEWSQKLMTISDFIDHHVTPPPKVVSIWPGGGNKDLNMPGYGVHATFGQI